MNLDVRYAAGLFDGEGWIIVNRWPRPGTEYVRYQLFVGIGMVHKPVIDQMLATFGGNLFVKKRSSGQSERTRTGFIWRLQSRRAADFLEQLLPWLVVKKDEAKLAIEFQQHIDAHKNEHRYRPESRAEHYVYRDAVLHQLRALKKREYYTPVDDDPSIAA